MSLRKCQYKFYKFIHLFQFYTILLKKGILNEGFYIYVSEYIFASHVSAEPAGKIALDYIGKKPYINCGMCLGEGTGAIIGGKLFDFALAGFNEAVGFQEIEVEQYKHLE